MTIKAVGVVTGLIRDNSNPGNFIATVQYAVVGESGFSEQSHSVYNLNPSVAGTTIQSQIESAMKTYLKDTIGVTFDLLDSFRLIPGIV